MPVVGWRGKQHYEVKVLPQMCTTDCAFKQEDSSLFTPVGSIPFSLAFPIVSFLHCRQHVVEISFPGPCF